MTYKDKKKRNEYYAKRRSLWRKNNPVEHNQSNRNWFKRRRDSFIKILGGVCAKCGSDNNLEFDHKNGDGKKHRMISGFNRNNTRVLVKMKKECPDDIPTVFQLLCHSCHVEKHRI